MSAHLATVGYGVRSDYYRQVEAGKKPGPDFIAALERLFGPMPPERVEVTNSGAGQSADITALSAIVTQLVTQLQEERREWREERDEWKRLVDRLLPGESTRLVEPRGPSDPDLRARESAALELGHQGGAPEAAAPRPIAPLDAGPRGAKR